MQNMLRAPLLGPANSFWTANHGYSQDTLPWRIMPSACHCVWTWVWGCLSLVEPLSRVARVGQERAGVEW